MKAFVTGGGGFLGSAIVRLLRARGDEVTSYSRGEYPELAKLGARHVRGDLGETRLLLEVMRGHDTVFHVAAKAGIALARDPFWSANVDGTRHVLAAALETGVERLVFTSSPSVCFDGADHKNASNDLPYAARFLAPYPESKAAAERMLLAANGKSALATCALRPHLVFGPGEAKGEFKKRLDHAQLGDKEVAVETVDKMTDHQISAKVREYFHHAKPDSAS